MALPDNIVKVKVSGTFLNTKGEPETAPLELQPNVQRVVDAANQLVISRAVFTAVPDEDTGYAEVEVPATGQDAWNPVITQYWVSEPGGSQYAIECPADGGDVDVSSVQKVAQASGGTVQIVAGTPGPKGDPGPPGGGITALAADEDGTLTATMTNDSTVDGSLWPADWSATDATRPGLVFTKWIDGDGAHVGYHRLDTSAIDHVVNNEVQSTLYDLIQGLNSFAVAGGFTLTVGVGGYRVLSSQGAESTDSSFLVQPNADLSGSGFEIADPNGAAGSVLFQVNNDGTIVTVADARVDGQVRTSNVQVTASDGQADFAHFLAADGQTVLIQLGKSGDATFAGTVAMRAATINGQAAVATNDSRLSNARTPTVHHSSHESAGTDPIAAYKLDGNVVGTTLAGSLIFDYKTAASAATADGVLILGPSDLSTSLGASVTDNSVWIDTSTGAPVLKTWTDGAWKAADTSRTLTWDGTTYQPEALLADTSAGRVFKGVTDPNTVDGVTLTQWDEWVPLDIDPPDDPGGGDDGGDGDGGDDGYAPMPTADNTGPSSDVTLTTHTGDYTLSSGSVSGLHITGNLILAGSDVSATDCLVDGAIFPNGGDSGHYPVLTNQTCTRVKAGSCWATGASDLTFDACHFGGVTSTFMQLTVYTSGGNTMTCSGVTIKNCLFDDLQNSSGTAHLEALHLMTVTDSVIQNNVFDFGQDADSATKSQITAAVTVENYQGNCDSLTFDHNWLYGGGAYQLYWNPTNSTLTNNMFNGYPNSSLLYPYGSPNSFTQSGNTLDGDPVTVTN